MVEIEVDKIKVRNEDFRNVCAFVALQNAASDYLAMTEEFMVNMYEQQLKEEFEKVASTNRNIRKRQEKKYKQDLIYFKKTFKDYKKRIDEVYNKFLGNSIHEVDETEQKLVGAVHEFIDKFIEYGSTRSIKETK